LHAPDRTVPVGHFVFLQRTQTAPKTELARHSFSLHFALLPADAPAGMQNLAFVYLRKP